MVFCQIPLQIHFFEHGFGEFQSFGGEVAAIDLPDYHYMMMPYFKEPVELAKFNSLSKKGMKLLEKIL
jgi:hypothetical protein